MHNSLRSARRARANEGVCRRSGPLQGGEPGEIAAQGFSLNPGRYVGASAREAEAEDFREKLEELQEEFERLTAEARNLENQVGESVGEIIGAA